MAAIIHDAASQTNRILYPANGGNRAGAQRWAIHDGRVHLDLAETVEGRARARVEEGIVFEDDDGGLDGIERGATALKYLPTRARGQLAAFEPVGKAIVFDRPGAAVHNNRGSKLWPHKTPTLTGIPGIGAKLGTTFKSFKPTARFFNDLNT
jgi:hypothetical protein